MDQTLEIPADLQTALADRYTLRRVLGRGGMATVYLADDKKHYRAVALKGGIADWLAANLPTETKEAPKQATPEPGALKG